MLVSIIKAPLKKTGSQDLSADAMSVTTAFAKRWQLTGVYIHFDAACSQDYTISRDSGTGADYDTVIKTDTLSSATDLAWYPTEEILDSGDEIKVAITKGGTANAYLEIVGYEI